MIKRESRERKGTRGDSSGSGRPREEKRCGKRKKRSDKGLQDVEELSEEEEAEPGRRAERGRRGGDEEVGAEHRASAAER